MKIGHLPDYIRVKALIYYLKKRDIYHLSFDITTVTEAYDTHLEDAFNWNETIEGVTYWDYCNNGQYKEANNYYNKIVANKPLYMMDGKPLEEKRLNITPPTPLPLFAKIIAENIVLFCLLYCICATIERSLNFNAWDIISKVAFIIAFIFGSILLTVKLVTDEPNK